MQTITLDLTPEQYHIPEEMQRAVGRKLHIRPDQIGHLQVVRRSLDSRRGQVKDQATLNVYSTS